MGRKATGGAGTLIGLCASVFLQSHTSWPKEHPHWVLALYSLTILFFLFMLLQFRFVQRIIGVQAIEDVAPKHGSVDAKDGIAIGGDVIGSRLDSSRGHTIIGDSALKQLVPPVPHPMPHFPPPPLPVLELSFGQPSVAVEDHTLYLAESGGVKCYSIHVHNRLAEAGGKASRADSISARITFQHEGSSPKTFVDRCCWIGKYENEIYLSPGDTEQVLCGIPKNMEWTTYGNPNQTSPGDWGHYRDLNKVVVDLFAGAKINGIISIVTHRNNQSTTLIKRDFVISVDQTGISVNARWRDES